MRTGAQAGTHLEKAACTNMCRTSANTRSQALLVPDWLENPKKFFPVSAEAMLIVTVIIIFEL